MLDSPDVSGATHETKTACFPLVHSPFYFGAVYFCSNISFLSHEFLYNQKVSLLSELPPDRARLMVVLIPRRFLFLRPNSKASHDYERLKSQCMRAMADLQSLQNQHTKTLKRCEEAVKEADFYQ